MPAALPFGSSAFMAPQAALDENSLTDEYGVGIADPASFDNRAEECSLSRRVRRTRVRETRSGHGAGTADKLFLELATVTERVICHDEGAWRKPDWEVEVAENAWAS